MGEERQRAHWPNERIDAATDLREENSEGVREEQAATVIQLTSCCKDCESDSRLVIRDWCEAWLSHGAVNREQRRNDSY